MGRGKSYGADEDAEIARVLREMASGAQRRNEEGVGAEGGSGQQDHGAALREALPILADVLKHRSGASIRQRAKLLLSKGRIFDDTTERDAVDHRVTGDSETKDASRSAAAVVEVEDRDASSHATEAAKWHKDGFPATFFRRSQQFVREDAEKNTFVWGTEVVARCREEFDDWARALEQAFPVRYDGRTRPHPSETLQYRSKQCKAEEESCWNSLDRHAISHAWKRAMPGTSLPSRVKENFRVDAFGNVVSITAKSKAVCAFEVDHVFPWSRGGCSRRGNFAAVYWGANNLKKEKLIQGSDLSPQPCVSSACAEKGRDPGTGRGLQVGLSVDMFVALFRYAREASSRRQDKNYLDSVAENWLICSRPAGQSKANLWSALGLHKRLDGMTEGEVEPAALWNAFEQLDAQMRNYMSRGLADRVASTAKSEWTSSPKVEEQEGGNVPEQKAVIEGDHTVRSVVSATKDILGKSISLLVDRDGVFARGTKTYDIRKQLKALGFKWSSETKSWFASLDEDIVTRVEDESRQRNIRVDLQYVQ